jgi:transcriptional pleiotropic regulator of transition state genes
VLQKFEPACIFCGSTRRLVAYRDRNICHDCVMNMKKI